MDKDHINPEFGSQAVGNIYVAPSGKQVEFPDYPQNVRWVVSRKEAVLQSIAQADPGEDRYGAFEHAMKYYGLSEEELGRWMKLSARFGQEGLRVTRGQKYDDLISRL